MPTATKPRPRNTQEEVKLGDVINDFDEWRANKTYSGQAIPDHLWLKIFKLGETMNLSRVKSVFGINSNQYNSKRQQLVHATLPSVMQDPTKNGTKSQDVFCEASVDESAVVPLTSEQPSTAQAVAHLKSNDTSPESYLDLSTIIVECIHPNGHRLKIHTSIKKIHEVMQAFITTGSSPA